MKTGYFKTGLDELIPCYVIEEREDSTIRVRLLADSKTGTYKQYENVHTLAECFIETELKFMCNKTIRYSRELIQGEIYEIIRIKYTYPTHMLKECLFYYWHGKDGRINQATSDYFDILAM